METKPAVQQPAGPPATQLSPAILEAALVGGDLSGLTPTQRLQLINAVCERIGLDPLLRPFIYIRTKDGKLRLYPTVEGAQQLRGKHEPGLTIVGRETIGDIYVVTVRARLPIRDKHGLEWGQQQYREDESTGCVCIAGLKGEDLANAFMRAECMPFDAEILTRDGFKTHDQLRLGEPVLAFDPECGICKWTPLQNVTTYPVAPVSRLFTPGGHFDVLCTPDHSWAVRSEPYKPDARGDGSRGPRGPYRNRKPGHRLVKASEIKAGQSIVMAAPEVETEASLLTPVEAAVLGWAVTDGTIKRVGNSVRIGICQSKEENFESIRETVAAMAPGIKEHVTPARERTFPWSGHTCQTKEQHWWYIPSAVTRAILDHAGYHDRCDLPGIVTRLCSPARKAMLQAMMLAEGDSRGVFANGDKHVFDAFDILCALEGRATGRLTPKDMIYTKRLKKTRHIAGGNLRVEESGEAPVWCPTTQYGTWVMRYYGQVCITGNSKAKRRVTLSIIGLGHLADVEPENTPGAENGHNIPIVLTDPAPEPAPEPKPMPPVKTPEPKAAEAPSIPGILLDVPVKSQDLTKAELAQAERYKERWEQLRQDAMALGLTVPPLPWPCHPDVVVEHAQALKTRITEIQEGTKEAVGERVG